MRAQAENQQPIPIEISFIRTSTSGIENYAKARLTTTNHVRPGADAVRWGMARLKAAVTDWVKNTEEGRDVWEQSAQDLNIGDLLVAGIGTLYTLRQFLAKHGIQDIALSSDDVSYAVNYDELLVDEDEVRFSASCVAIH